MKKLRATYYDDTVILREDGARRAFADVRYNSITGRPEIRVLDPITGYRGAGLLQEVLRDLESPYEVYWIPAPESYRGVPVNQTFALARHVEAPWVAIEPGAWLQV